MVTSKKKETNIYGVLERDTGSQKNDVIYIQASIGLSYFFQEKSATRKKCHRKKCQVLFSFPFFLFSEMAMESRQPKGTLMHHSDQGSQYSSRNFKQRLDAYNIQSSMSRKGNCYDNAVVESFFKTLKIEWTRQRKYKTREEARSSIFEFIEIFYNKNRLHSSIGYLSPVEYERKSIHLN